VAKHSKHPRGRASVASLPELKARTTRAFNEGRYQAALELARSLFKQEPTPANREVLQKATLGRARQLRNQGYVRDATTVLQNAAALAEDPLWIGQLAEEFAACGEVAHALRLLTQVPDAPARQRIQARAADAALLQGKVGRQLLPADLHPQFDLIMQAFGQAEAGHDEEARATLQGIGLASSFLEWKVFLRGLLAYYQKDDSRALENWQRLDGERLPARLAAPLRFQIDREYRAAQPAPSQRALQQQADRLGGSGLVPSLRTLQTHLNNEEQLPQAFRLAEGLVPHLRREAPHLTPRLASCFYWAVVDHGQPEDVSRYKRVFGAPADDPLLARLRALSLEDAGLLDQAHREWQTFEKSVADNPSAWPGDLGTRTRALVWTHMGHNAGNIPDLEKLDMLPPFLRDHPDRPRPLNPGAEECYRYSIELAPDVLEPYEALFEHFRDKKKKGKAIQAGRRLLKRFPEHVQTLEALADLLMEKQEYPEALQLYERAARANPLERRLRRRIGAAHTYNARTFAEQGAFEQARTEYQAALAFSDNPNDSSILCKWAACEFKAANDARAEELLVQAHADAGHRLAVAFSMLIECIRLKLPRPIKNRFDGEFKEALAEPPSAVAAMAVADTTAAHHLAGVDYFGQKTHEKKVLAYLSKARKTAFTEEQLRSLCESLQALRSPRLLRAYIQLGQKRFPQSPEFFLAEAELELARGPRRAVPWRISEALKDARERAAALPRDERQKTILERVQKGEETLRLLNPFAALFGGMMEEGLPFDPFGGLDFDDDEDDEFQP
jgi:tetratricopeptide (TPR) repeat protein